MKATKIGHPLGIHRVVEPLGQLPQAAWMVDASMEIWDNEILLQVETLNIDSASFTQIREQCHAQEDQMAAHIEAIVSERGKMHNPVTGSGGMLIGRVVEIGPRFPAAKQGNLQIGDRIATLVSLTLTPLTIQRISKVHVETAQVDVEGQAIVFASGLFARVPEDVPERVSLAVLDVCGAPAQVARLVQHGQTVVIVGAGGKSGLLSLCQARRSLGDSGAIVAIEQSPTGLKRIRQSGWADHIIEADARDTVGILQEVERVTRGQLADVTINCVNVPDTEMSSIVVTRDRGTVYFFSMATSFTKAALGAEGIGKNIDLLIGNGYAAGHAEHALELLRAEPKLFRWFSADHEQVSQYMKGERRDE